MDIIPTKRGEETLFLLTGNNLEEFEDVFSVLEALFAVLKKEDSVRGVAARNLLAKMRDRLDSEKLTTYLNPNEMCVFTVCLSMLLMLSVSNSLDMVEEFIKSLPKPEDATEG